MHKVFDCAISDSTLDMLVKQFVPEKDVYFFIDEEIFQGFLEQGVSVYTREEFQSSFPSFAVEFGSLYLMWTLKIPRQSYVVFANERQLSKLNPEIRQKLLAEQIHWGRGHIYRRDWFTDFSWPKTNTLVIDEEWHYLLTTADWGAFNPQTRREWVLKWLREWRQDEPSGVTDFPRGDDRVPYGMIEEYAGSFTHKAGANCFAAAVAMAVGGTKENVQQSRVLIEQWLHQEPFFRLLKAQGYSKYVECCSIADLHIVQPSDVLVWYTNDGTAGHAAFAVSNRLVFQKHGQGWESPWQVLRVDDVWYNEFLKDAGHVAVYRSQ